MQELILICSLRTLLKPQYLHLHIPYLPYARQDKSISNISTFNLETFADIINPMNFHMITSVDVHNMEASKIINNLIENNHLDYIIFPDSGAYDRYFNKIKDKYKTIEGIKTRNQLTGEITGLTLMNSNYDPVININNYSRCLIIDYICDGGKTFIEVTKALKNINETAIVNLYVTHGIFSKGKQVLHDAGIANIYTTNSLLKNTDGFKV